MRRHRQRSLLVCLGLFLTSCFSVEWPSEALPSQEQSRQAVATMDEAWSPVESMARARLLHTATALNDGQVLVVGGVQRLHGNL